MEIDELRAEVERVTALHDELLGKAQRGELELGAVSAEHAAEIEAERARQAAAHERRVEHLTQVAARRLGKRELSLGWQTWLELWEIKSRQMRQMRAVQARIRHPLISASFLEWRRGWESFEDAERTRLTAKTTNQLLEERDTAIAHLEAELEQAREELAREVHSLGSDYAERLAAQVATAEKERTRQLSEQIETETSKRVSHSVGIAVRRLGKQQLSKGWQTWLDGWLEQQRHKRMLAACGARLSRPQLAAACAHWRRDWESALADDRRLEQSRKADAKAEAKGRELGEAHTEAMSQTEQRLQAEVAALQQRLGASLDEHLASSNDDAARRKREEAAAETAREKRVEHLCGVAARRIGQLQLARGWSAWSEGSAERQRRLHALKRAAGRIVRPKQAAALTAWRIDWEREQARGALRKHGRALTAKADAERAELQSQLAGETTQAKLRAAAAEDEKLAFLAKSGDMEEQHAQMRKQLQAAKRATEEAELQLEEQQRKTAAATKAAEEKTAAATAAAEASLQGLLGEQRAAFAAEAKKKGTAWELERADLELQLKELRAKLMRAGEAPTSAPIREAPAEEKKKEPFSAKDLKAKRERKKGSLLGDFDIDEDSGVPIGEQLKQALVKNAGRVIDLFREWDADGDGEITKKEFRAAMTRMGLDLPPKDVDGLFDSWDPSGGGEQHLGTQRYT